MKWLSRVRLFATPWTVASVHEIFQARTLEWVAISFSRGSSQPRDRTWVSHIVGRRFYHLSHQGSLSRVIGTSQKNVKPELSFTSKISERGTRSKQFLSKGFWIHSSHQRLKTFPEGGGGSFIQYGITICKKCVLWTLLLEKGLRGNQRCFPNNAHACSVVSNSLQPHGLKPSRLLHPWDFSGKDTGVSCLHNKTDMK